MPDAVLLTRYAFHCLCSAAEAVFLQWWEQRKDEARAVMRRCATAYLVRQTRVKLLPNLYEWYSQSNMSVENVLVMPEEMDWYMARMLPRYFRLCTEKLRVTFEADIRYRRKHQKYSKFHAMRIEKLQMLSMWAFHMQKTLVETAEEPLEVTILRRRVNVVVGQPN